MTEGEFRTLTEAEQDEYLEESRDDPKGYSMSNEGFSRQISAIELIDNWGLTDSE